MPNNARSINLAMVSSAKLAEDENLFSGMTAVGRYFDDEDRADTIVQLDENGYLKSSTDLSGKLMYAVLPSGELCVGNVTVHSQFNAGKPVQSAGWLTIQDGKITTIDNNSGHYTPTMSQFISTLIGLHEAKLIPDNLQIEFNATTKMDYSFTKSLFKQLIAAGRCQISFCDSYAIITSHDGQNSQRLYSDLCKNGPFTTAFFPEPAQAQQTISTSSSTLFSKTKTPSNSNTVLKSTQRFRVE